jgi:hypothetical protein
VMQLIFSKQSIFLSLHFQTASIFCNTLIKLPSFEMVYSIYPLSLAIELNLQTYGSGNRITMQSV